MELPKTNMKRILKNAGAERVSDGAAKELGHLLEIFAGDVCEEAVAKAQENNKKTIRREDIIKASR